jgi:coenzyme F420 biosynthesis associated uncharacterized protein
VVSTAPSTDVPDIIDWNLAARVGRRVAGGSELVVEPAWKRQFGDISAVADRAVAEFTGLGGELEPPTAVPLDRGRWVEANLATLRRVLRPVAEKVASRRAWRDPGAIGAAARGGTRALTAAQAGTLLGYIAQRVLGQYDLPMPGPEADGEGTVWYVVPNIVQVERRHGFRPAHFRLWIALHETTHRRQFRGVPWLPGHIQGLLDQYLGSVEVDDEALRRLARRAQSVARRAIAGDRIELLDFLLTPEQRGIVDRMQATMSVLEGHGEWVMEQLGARLVPGHDVMHRVLRERRSAGSPADRFFQQALGFKQKLDQYSAGERFLRHLHQRGGMQAVNLVFSAPDAMPTKAELRDPDHYLARVG